ncbi:MAG: hypothetical protein ACRCWR_06365, partial [Saezia sp.]
GTLLNPAKRVFAGRTSVRNTYQFISLAIMKQASEEDASIPYTDSVGKALLDECIAELESGSYEFKKFKDFAISRIFELYHGVKRGLRNDINFKIYAELVLRDFEAARLYHDYIHNSLYLDILDETADAFANEGRSNNKDSNGNPLRPKINDNA